MELCRLQDVDGDEMFLIVTGNGTYESMKELKSHMTKQPELFEEGVLYTLIKRRPLLKIVKTLKVVVE